MLVLGLHQFWPVFYLLTVGLLDVASLFVKASCIPFRCKVEELRELGCEKKRGKTRLGKLKGRRIKRNLQKKNMRYSKSISS
jgi:hypothetical protein